jgi:hypothetical protein
MNDVPELHFSHTKPHKMDRSSNALTAVQRAHVACITKATRRITLKDLGVDKGYFSATAGNPKDLWGILRYINMHNDRYNATAETNVRSHHDVLDTEYFLPKPSPSHFQQYIEKEKSNETRSLDDDINPFSMNYNGITELSLENWESINTLTLRSIALFLGSNVTAVSFAKCCNLTDEMIHTFTANTVNLQKLDISECIQLTDSSIRVVVQCCSKTLLGMNLSKCILLTNDSCRWIAGGCSFDVTKENFQPNRKEKKSTHKLRASFGCKYLRHLNLSGCTQIGDLGIRHIGWGYCRDLSHLNISGCCCITENGLVDALLKVPTYRSAPPLCHKLQVLNLEGCESVTHQGLLTLIHARNDSKIANIGNVLEATTFFGFYSPLLQSNSNTRPPYECEASRDHEAASQIIQRGIRRSRYKASVNNKPRVDENIIKASICIQVSV